MGRNVALAIFDLDNTLLRGDSDYLWGMYLIDKRAVDQESHQRENERFYQEYINGQMDIMAFLRFQLAPLARIPLSELLKMREDYIENYIKPIITEQSLKNAQNGEYTFDVDPSATKGQIKQAVETYFDVSVTRVRTAKLAGKTKRVGKLKKKIIKTDRKKAMVKVKSGQKISIFEVQG